MKKTVLVTGANGFIGKAFIRHFKEKYRFIGVDVIPNMGESLCSQFYCCSICDTEKMAKIFVDNKVDIVIHTAAEKSLILCEQDKERAFETNYLATLELLGLAEQSKCKFIFISSDQVFDGSGSMYSENSYVNAINQYGKLKIFAEHQLLQHSGAAICRTALVFGEIHEEQINYFKKVCLQSTLAVQGYIVQQTICCLRENRRLILPDDEFVSPTHVLLLAEQLDKVIENNVSGILHCCGKDCISRYEMGLCIAKHFNIENIDCIIRRGEPNPLRPKNVSMDCTHTERLLQMRFLSFSEMLDKYMPEGSI